MNRTILAIPLAVIACLGSTSLGAQGQPRGIPADNIVVAALPAPPVDENADAGIFLTAAERALAAGRNGEAQEALEMAQTRLLDRSVPLGQTGVPSDQPSVKLISQALQALAAGDRAGCLRLIHEAARVVRPQ